MTKAPDKTEQRHVSMDDLEAGVTAKAGHPLILLVGGQGGGGTGDDPTGDEGSNGTATAPPDDPTGPPDVTGDEGGGGTTQDEGGSGDEGVPDAPPGGKIDLQLVSVSGKPVPNMEVEVSVPGGSKRAGKTDANGHFLVEGNLPASGLCFLLVPDVPGGDDEGAHVDHADEAAHGGETGDHFKYQPNLPLAIGGTPVVELPARVSRGKLTGAHFETDKTFLLPSAMAGIRELRALYESFGPKAVIVSGHTDTVGDAAYNLGLSVERAESIKAYLTDAVDDWMKNYQKQPHSSAWGVREDQYMLATLQSQGAPYYAAKVDGAAGPKTADAYKKFQGDKGLGQSGKGDEATRKALITDYMALDGTTLPADTQVLTHGCGLTHLAEQTGPNKASLANRRVELFLFETDPNPAPQTPCPSGGCAEYAQWVAQSGLVVDLDQPAGTIQVVVSNADDNSGVDGANVHAAGPTSHDETTAKGGRATFSDRVPGHYKLIVDAVDFDAGEVEVDVASGQTAQVTVPIKPKPPMKFSKVGARAITQDEADKIGGAK
ncbi:MAG: OmpA family protein [Deltaproteobacteria bacterium]|nr:OmpA family protein [Deltaproteobacteria bacterium]